MPSPDQPLQVSGAPDASLLLDHLLQHGADAVVVVALDAEPPTVVAASAAHEALFGRVTVGRPFAEHTPPEMQRSLARILAGVAEHGPTTTAGQWREGDTVRKVGTTWHPLVDGERRYVVGHAVDASAAPVSAPDTMLLETLLDAAVVERRRIAQHLHDDTIQVLAAVTMELALLRRRVEAYGPVVDGLRQTLQAANGRIRSLLADLDPVAHAVGRLGDALLDALADEAAAAGVTLVIDDELEAELPEAVAEALYWIGAEAVRNSLRHAGVDAVEVRILPEADGVRLVVADLGRGFDVLAPAVPGHYGLRSIQARARRLGGVAGVQSAIGHGTKVGVWIPLEPTGGDAPADQSEQHLAAAIRDLDAHLRLLWSATDIAMLLGDRTALVLRANPAAVRRYGGDPTGTSITAALGEYSPVLAAVRAVVAGTASSAEAMVGPVRYRAQRLPVSGGPPWDWLLCAFGPAEDVIGPGRHQGSGALAEPR